MGALDRYIAASLATGWLLVLSVMLAIFGLLKFVDELEHVTGQYKVIDAAIFVVRTLPQIGLELAPVVGLLGTLMVLANLSRNSELISMSAAGMSPARLSQAVLVPAGLLVIFLYAVTEYAAAPLYQRAEETRAAMRNGFANILGGNGLWSNNQRRFLNVRNLKHGQIPVGIDYYDFAPDGRLLMFANADHADVDPTREWHLKHVQIKKWTRSELATTTQRQLDMGLFWSKDELPVLSLSSSAMSIVALYGYLEHLKSTGQRSEATELALWQKLTQPLATFSMICLAIPLGAGIMSQRTSGYGRRIATGALIGIVFYLGSQIVHLSGSLLGIKPVVLTLFPIGVALIIANRLFRKMS